MTLTMAMTKEMKKKIKWRTIIVFCGMVLFLVPFCVSLYNTMVRDGDEWKKRSRKIAADSLMVLPVRGNILACDGQLMASSIPVYVLHMDFQADALHRDSFLAHVDSLSYYLSTIYTDKSPAQMKQHLMTGFKKGSRWYCVGKRNLSYVEMKRVKTFPLLNKVKCYGFNKRVNRKLPYGDMASRTIGGLYAELDKGGKSGIEKYCDSLLKGRPGLASRVKVAGAYREINDVDAQNGLDIVTTIDVNIQDIVDSDLRHRLAMSEAEFGCAAVMEVATGEIKAMSNLKRRSDGSYVEGENYVTNGHFKCEPGSTFKIASAVIALEKGKVDTSTIIETGNGSWPFYGRTMHDSHANGTISFNKAIQQSSNIAVAKVIDNAFKNNPEEYIEALYDLGLSMPLGLEIPGAKPPHIKHPSDKGPNGWYKTSLPWIAHGYETDMPPIQILTFYNALANGGKMMRPHLLKAESLNGRVVKSYGSEVLKSKICSEGNLGKVKQMMVDVVEHGTATAAKSKYFKIAGKTGTANQVYHSSVKRQQLTFCGFFPADAPKYSMIVVAWYPHKGATGAGSLSGATFKDIAEHIYAQSPLMQTAPMMKGDTTRLLSPVTKAGDRKSLEMVMEELDVNYHKSKVAGEWVRTHVTENGVRENKVIAGYAKDRVPDVTDMGLKDAIFLLENRGLKVYAEGTGVVKSQSLEEGRFINKGESIKLILR